MAQPSRQLPTQPANGASSLTDRIETWFPAALCGAPRGRRVRHIAARVVGDVVVLEVAGPLRDVVEGLDRAIAMALAELPRGVACDLTAVSELGDSDPLHRLAEAGRHARDWPGIPVVMACPDAPAREALHAQPLSRHLLITRSLRLALSAVRGTVSPPTRTRRLAPHPTSPRAARDFVTSTLVAWKMPDHLTDACLVASELVTNAMEHAGTDIDVSLTEQRAVLRVTVRDGVAALPAPRTAGLGTTGRGLTLVHGLSSAWGVLPTADGGKVVWALLDASPDAAAGTERHLPPRCA
jgi:histidine kinase-like protein